ncbi:hypothetical protein E2562_018218 [Oryza meyeriana var. granulata]|uniref:Uncharacterized protein n=1 Tax=Oryza meyeriana var. granulata TaxID=110450 RepID=A0A6G1CI94_9ORYZ|nr:hypothetical protein E2562_018218 [Oryza meyeriana var. granulata]
MRTTLQHGSTRGDWKKTLKLLSLFHDVRFRTYGEGIMVFRFEMHNDVLSNTPTFHSRSRCARRRSKTLPKN